MNLYLISQDHNAEYDTYDSAVVAAHDESQARLIHPSRGLQSEDSKEDEYDVWTLRELVKVELIGKAVNGTSIGVICSSFNAG